MVAVSDVEGINLQIIALTARLSAILAGMKAEGITEGLKGVLEDQLIDEVKHLQVLIIELTKKVSGDDSESMYEPEPEPVLENTDGESAFAEGELADKPKRPEKEREYPEF